MSHFKLDKTIWTEKDFDQMGWHDVKIWSICADDDKHQFLLDLDYIFSWVAPGENEKYYKFWVAPVTMIFENAYDLEIDIKSIQGCIEIDHLHMINPMFNSNDECVRNTYRFECQQGDISLTATGFKMYVRQIPILINGQYFDLTDRGGISFAYGENLF